MSVQHGRGPEMLLTLLIQLLLLSDLNWVNAMHEELENFERNQVWELVELRTRSVPVIDG
jgi:hypothetical protein